MLFRSRTIEHTHYKAYPCCRWAHPSLDAVQELIQRHELTPDQITAVIIRTFHYATRLAGHEPQTLDDLAYGIAFPVATMIVRGRMGIEELTPETLKDPEILRISRATTLIDDPEMTRISVAKRWAQVTLVTTDGREFADEPRTPRGDADSPFSEGDINAKFHAFADPVLGARRATRIADLTGQFDKLDDGAFTELTNLCLSDV